jgi:UDPglucose--hexose-1-phosphate uridylyltransferase
MNGQDIAIEIEMLLQFALNHNMIEKMDVIPARNNIMELLGVTEPYSGELKCEVLETPVPILEKVLDYAVERGIIPDNTVTFRDLFDTKIMGILMPRQSEVARNFWNMVKTEGIKKATDDFYKLSQYSNYIRMDRIERNLYWETKTPYGTLEITINLSKPEKDPRDIAAARLQKQTNYPRCLLCIENVGFGGNLNHPARQNHRVIPVTLDKEQWFFQYSPYVYYNEHCIVLHENHMPMKISLKTFERLFDFIEQFPHYFIGSNADLPIVGGSILNHEHFQGGRHEFPMERAVVERYLVNKDYQDVSYGILKWPLSVLRLSGNDRKKLSKLAGDILKAWRDYSDEEASIFAYSEVDGQRIPHNTITPIARKNKNGEFELDLVLRNNRTSLEHPYGIFHPHKELHHIKKENIGLIEVMGLAVLPGRLYTELKEIGEILAGKKAYANGKYKDGESMIKHAPWIEEMINTKGTRLTVKDAEEYLRAQVADKFLNVLSDAGVYRRDEKGMKSFLKFAQNLGFVLKE